MQIYVYEQGRPDFHDRNIFPRLHSVYCLMPRPEMCSLLGSEKLLEILFIQPECFFQFSRLENYSRLAHGRARKTSGIDRERFVHLWGLGNHLPDIDISYFADLKYIRLLTTFLKYSA
jgi:hypothetical protein